MTENLFPATSVVEEFLEMKPAKQWAVSFPTMDSSPSNNQLHIKTSVVQYAETVTHKKEFYEKLMTDNVKTSL
jgi:hypothetical protein